MLATALLAGLGNAQPATQPVPVPDAAVLAATRERVLGQLLDSAMGKGEVAAVMERLQQLIAASPDQAAVYVILERAVALAERRHEPALAMAVVGLMHCRFAVDRVALWTDMLTRLANDAEAAPAAVAITAWHCARQAAWQPDPAPMRRLLELAERAADRSADPWLRKFLSSGEPTLLALHAEWARWRGTGENDGAATLARLRDAPEDLLATPFGALVAGLPGLDGRQAGRTLRQAGPERLLALAPRAADGPVTRRGLLHAAQRLLAESAPQAADAAAQGVMARQLASITTSLADQDGITRFRFRQGEDLGQLVITHGKWRVEDGMLIGGGDGEDNHATCRHAFRDVRSVLIRGGIRSAAGLNFRLAAGEVNLICNWEVEPQNHLWIGDRRDVNAPPALEPGREQVIGLYQCGADVLVFVDDRLLFHAPGRLDGTVTVYPALGSEIFVREVLVDAELDCAGPVAGPSRRLKG